VQTRNRTLDVAKNHTLHL